MMRKQLLTLKHWPNAIPAGVGVPGRCDAHVLAGVIPDGLRPRIRADSMGASRPTRGKVGGYR
jgi:hypothetical protein